MSLELIGFDALAELIQRLSLGRSSHSARVELRAVAFDPNDVTSGIGQVEKMQVQRSRKFVADANPANAVPMRVQRRREHANAELAWENRDDPAGDAALGGHADLVNPFPCIIIHAAGAHHAENAFHVFATDRLGPGDGVDDAVGERGRHDSQIAARD